MTNMRQRTLFAALCACVALYGCDDNNDTDAGAADGGGATDGGGGGDAGGGNAPTCETYCDTVMNSCTAGNAVYTDRAECVAICGAFGWGAGDEVTVSGPLDGNTIGCRTYHGGAPATEDATTHCPHAGPTGAGVCGDTCEVYCTAALSVCSGADAIYADMGTCMTACAGLDATADIGVTSGDSVQCRMYHLGVAASGGDTATHCPHAGEDGGGVCVGGWTFRTDDPATAYTRVDHMGMPAVSTVLAGTYTETDEASRNAIKNTYNDMAPETPPSLQRTIVANLTALNEVLSDDLVIDNSLTSCAAYTAAPTGTPGDSLAGTVANVEQCLAQAAAAVIPDRLSVNTAMPLAFPNGRDLPDPVIDMTLSLILLDQSVHNLRTIVDAPDVGNPTANDEDFLTTFPYLAPPHTP